MADGSVPSTARTYVLAANATLFHADSRDALKALPSDCLDSCVTDPPYHLTSIVKRYSGEERSNLEQPEDKDLTTVKAGAFRRLAGGFMGKTWDGGDIAFQPDFWAEVYRVLKPGAFLCAFGASRGYHRMTCAIEDAGFEIRDSLLDLVNPDEPIAQFMDSLNDAQRDAFVRAVDHAAPGGPLAWLYGTGFPKSHDVSRGIDKAAGAEREIVGFDSTRARPNRQYEAGAIGNVGGSGHISDRSDNGATITAPATDAAREWEGWGTALKPAFEPIVLARKPLSEGTVAANVLRWRTGALNIGACRVEARDGDAPVSWETPRGGIWRTDAAASAKLVTTGQGRWPANVVHSGEPEVIAAFPDSKGASAPVRGDSGSASRFFYSAKASKADRAGSKHPTVKPVSLIQWLARLVTPPGGTVLDPFAGSGTTGAACRIEGFNCIMVEREAEYVADILTRFDNFC